MATIVSSQSLAAAATLTSSATAWVNNAVIICTCRIGANAPSHFCKVALLGTIDGTNYVQLDVKSFGQACNQSYYRSFRLSDYLGAGAFTNPEALERLNSSAAPPAIWTYFELVFSGNDTQAVTIAAVD